MIARDSVHTVRRAFPFVLIVLVAVAVYGRALDHAFLTTWDDPDYVTGNPDIRGLSADNLRAVFSRFYVGNYAPVQMLSYMLDYSLWGLTASGFLLTNLVLQIANGLLLYRIVFRLQGGRLAATVGALVFLIHPVQVESVVWISQRKNLLAMFFFLLAFGAYLRYCRNRQPGGRRRLVYAASLVFFTAAMLAKSVAIILPVVILLYDRCYADGDERLRLAEKMPYLLVAALAALLTVLSQKGVDSGWNGAGGGIAAGYHGGSPLATFYTMLPVFCTYLKLLVWPAGLSAQYGPAIHARPDGSVVLAGGLLVGIGLLTYLLWTWDRRLGFWALFFWIALLPVSQIVPLVTLMNDRYLYFPMVGAAALAGSGAGHLYARFRSRLTTVVLFLPVLFLGAASFQRVGVWKDSVTLWSDAVSKVPSAGSYRTLGDAYKYEGQNDRAMAAYLRAVAIAPLYPEGLYAVAELGSKTGDYETALDALDRLLGLKSNHVMAWALKGYVHARRGELSRAEEAYLRALALQPDSFQVLSMLGNLKLAAGELAAARDSFLKAESMLHDAETAYQLACVAARAGADDEALRWLETASQRGFTDRDRLLSSDDWRGIRIRAARQTLMNRYFR